MRILYSFPHPVGHPGIGTTALNQVRALAAAGADLTLICTTLHEVVPSSVRVIETLRIGGRRVPHRAFGSPDWALAYHDRRVAQLLRKAGRNYDVVHAWPQSALHTLRSARRAGCIGSREVPNAHTAEAFSQAARESALVGVALSKGHSHRPDRRRLELEEAEYRAADLLMVPSAHVAQTFLDRGFPDDRLGRHQYGFDSERFKPRSVSKPGRPFTAAFVGRAEPRKGLHYALRAWRDAVLPKGSTFVIAGSFAPGYREVVGPWLEDPSVNCVGFVEDVPTLLASSDVLMLPSVEEGSALVTYEAQACGCVPLVSASAGALLPPGLDDCVHQPRDVQALTRQLESLAQDPARRADVRRAVVAWSPSLTWEAAGRRMVQIYGRALADRR